MTAARPALAAIHIARKELGLTEDEYRAVLVRVTGKSSSAVMSDAERGRVLEEFKRLGWKGRGERRRPPSRDPQVRKVFALWGALARAGTVRNGSRAALRAFVKRMTGVEDPEWLEPDQAGTVIEALKAIERRGPPAPGAAP